MDSKQPSPNPEVARPWAPTRWLLALAIVAAVSFIALDAGTGPAHPEAQGRLPRTAAPAPTLRPAVLDDVFGTPTTTTTVPPTTTTSTPPPPVEDNTLHTPEDVPDPSERRSIGVMGRIAIPTIGLSADLRDQITQESIDLGPSHWPGTAAPGGLGNVVIAGHRSLHSAPFHDVGELHVGDPIVLTDAAGRQFTYHVTEMFVVKPDAMWITDQTPGHTLTLFTCHPIGSAAERLVIRGTLA
jgi:sortase A